MNESVQRCVWTFDLTSDRELKNKQLLLKFDDFSLDRMRCDVDGNLYVTRNGKGTVVKISPKGDVRRDIDVLGQNPTNICFGGSDGCTAYVTEAQRGTRRAIPHRPTRTGMGDLEAGVR